jgi:uncharacterized protein YdeI (YjbR/CyaY-like superfamily)
MVERKMIIDPDVFFKLGCGRCDRYATPNCTTRTWLEGILDLRRICRDLGLEEVAKWGHPTYMHAGRNIAIMGTFKENYRLTLMNAALMKDPEGILKRQGANTRHPDMIFFTDNKQVMEMEPVIRAYLLEAMGYAEKGLKPEKVVHEVEMPDELIEALDSDPELAEAFEALTPGSKRAYAYALNAAKQSKTRYDRIEKFRDKIFAGKGPLDR